MPEHPAGLAHHFADMDQQRESATLGMWTFLVTEVLFFGGMFTAYSVYRFQYPIAFVEGSHHLDVLLGAINTAVLKSGCSMIKPVTKPSKMANGTRPYVT